MGDDHGTKGVAKEKERLGVVGGGGGGRGGGRGRGRGGREVAHHVQRLDEPGDDDLEVLEGCLFDAAREGGGRRRWYERVKMRRTSGPRENRNKI